MTSPSFVRHPDIRRESILADHAAPVDHLFSLVRPAVPPPQGDGRITSRAYSSELTPRSRTARPFPNLSTLPSKRLDTERAPATAHVQYLIWADENGDSTFASDEYVAGPWLDQQTHNGGWQSLGVHNLRGRVRIEVRDTRTRDDYRDIGLVNASLAVDAIRLRKVRSQ